MENLEREFEIEKRISKIEVHQERAWEAIGELSKNVDRVTNNQSTIQITMQEAYLEQGRRITKYAITGMIIILIGILANSPDKALDAITKFL